MKKTTVYSLCLAAGTAFAQPTVSYKNPTTGQDCVRSTTVLAEGGNFKRVNFVNSCENTFIVKIRLRVSKQVRSTGIPGGSTYKVGTSSIVLSAADMSEEWDYWVDK